jgi:hypothetical protein
MYERHDLFKAPPDPNERIWRYVDFTKLVSMLHTRSLFFCRADKLSDPFEGSYTALVNRQLKERIEEITQTFKDNPTATRNLLEGVNHMPQIRREARKRTAINCWHRNERESAAMWALYLKSDEGIAISSTFARLLEALSESPSKVMIGAVDYIDYETEGFRDWGNLFSAFLHKRKSFEHERELRAVVQDEQTLTARPSVEPWTDGGVSIKVDLDVLVDTIYIAPSAPAWFASVVAATIAQFGRSFPVVQSDLAKEPLF